MSTKPLPKKPVDTSVDDSADSEDDLAIDVAITALSAIALVNGMAVYNDFKLRSIKDNDGEVVTWVTHPEYSVSGVCDYCILMEGEQFTVDEAPVLPEDSHVNCSCEMVYVNDPTDDLYNMDEFND